MRKERKINKKDLEIRNKTNVKYPFPNVCKLINKVMICGKKQKAFNIVDFSMEEIKAKLSLDPLEVFEQAVLKASPKFELKSRKMGGKVERIPVELKDERKVSIAIRRLVLSARVRKDVDEKDGRKLGIGSRLAREIIDTSNGSSATIKMKESDHKIAEANFAFANMRNHS